MSKYVCVFIFLYVLFSSNSIIYSKTLHQLLCTRRWDGVISKWARSPPLIVLLVTATCHAGAGDRRADEGGVLTRRAGVRGGLPEEVM